MAEIRIYQVANWNDHFENSRSREIEECSWVAIPNKHHGSGFSRLLASPDGLARYGLWCLIIQLCSRQISAGECRRNGWMTDDGRPSGHPWDAEDLAIRWRQNPDFVQECIDLLCSPRINWMRVHDHVPAECPIDGGLSADGRQLHAIRSPRRATRREEKGREVNETPPTSTALFRVLSVDERQIRQELDKQDLLGVVQAFGGNVSPDRHAEWHRESDQATLHEIIAIFAWRRGHRDLIREPSGLRKARALWKSEPLADRRALAIEFLKAYGIEPPVASEGPSLGNSVALIS